MLASGIHLDGALRSCRRRRLFFDVSALIFLPLPNEEQK
jgi:hypothetical protein